MGSPVARSSVSEGGCTRTPLVAGVFSAGPLGGSIESGSRNGRHVHDSGSSGSHHLACPSPEVAVVIRSGRATVSVSYHTRESTMVTVTGSATHPPGTRLHAHDALSPASVQYFFIVCSFLATASAMMSTLAQEPGLERRKVSFRRDILSSDSSSSDDLTRTPSETSSIPSYRQIRQYKVYHWRWLMLASLCLLNISNGMVGSMYGTAAYFGASLCTAWRTVYGE